jgi:hypothetical protein
MSFSVDSFEVCQITRFAHQQAQTGSFARERTRHVVAYESGRACNENSHRNALGKLHCRGIRRPLPGEVGFSRWVLPSGDELEPFQVRRLRLVRYNLTFRISLQ